MKEKLKGLIVGIIIGVLLVPTVFATVGTVTKDLSYNNIKITLNGAELKPTDAAGNYVEPFIIDGTTYLPVRGVANALGLDVSWDGSNNTVVLSDGTVSGGAEGDVAKAGDVVYNANGVKVTLTNIKETDSTYQYDFLLENNTDYIVFFEGNGISVNDFMVPEEIVFYTQPHKKNTSTMYLSKEMLKRNGSPIPEKIDINTQCEIYSEDFSVYEVYKSAITILQ